MPFLRQYQRMKGIADAVLRDGHLYGSRLEYVMETTTRDSDVSVSSKSALAARKLQASKADQMPFWLRETQSCGVRKWVW